MAPAPLIFETLSGAALAARLDALAVDTKTAASDHQPLLLTLSAGASAGAAAR